MPPAAGRRRRSDVMRPDRHDDGGRSFAEDSGEGIAIVLSREGEMRRQPQLTTTTCIFLELLAVGLLAPFLRPALIPEGVIEGQDGDDDHDDNSDD